MKLLVELIYAWLYFRQALSETFHWFSLRTLVTPKDPAPVLQLGPPSIRTTNIFEQYIEEHLEIDL